MLNMPTTMRLQVILHEISRERIRLEQMREQLYLIETEVHNTIRLLSGNVANPDNKEEA